MSRKIIFSEWNKDLEVVPEFPLIKILKDLNYPRNCSFKLCKKDKKKILSYLVKEDPEHNFDEGSPYQILSGSCSTRAKHLDFRFKIGSFVGTLVAGKGGCARSSFHYVVKKTPKGPVLRYLTPEECEQLQGWPIGHTAVGANNEKVSDSLRYDLIGNGISSIVSSTLIKELTQDKPGNVLSLFAGAGGTELLFDKEKHPVVAYCEIKKHALSILKRIHPEAESLGPIQSVVNFKPKKKIDIITGGFPCQSYSYVGSRGGLKDKRGKLFFALAYAILKFKPQFALLENVLGILTIDEGRTLEFILKTLRDIGYEVEARTCFSSDYGLRQARGRVFFLMKRIYGAKVPSQTVEMIESEFKKIK